MGGAQENALRAGTEAMPQIAAFGEACEIAKKGMAYYTAEMARLRQRTIEKIGTDIPEDFMLDALAKLDARSQLTRLVVVTRDEDERVMLPGGRTVEVMPHRGGCGEVADLFKSGDLFRGEHGVHQKRPCLFFEFLVHVFSFTCCWGKTS